MLLREHRLRLIDKLSRNNLRDKRLRGERNGHFYAINYENEKKRKIPQFDDYEMNNRARAREQKKEEEEKSLKPINVINAAPRKQEQTDKWRLVDPWRRHGSFVERP